MRVYGRINGGINGVGGTWVEVSTDAAGYNSNVFLTALAQVLKLNLGESPAYGNAGIPGQQSVNTQVPPDLYASITQQNYAQYFRSLVITRVPGSNPPFYNARAVCQSGAILAGTVAL